MRGGGHNVAGNGVCDGGLMIDLSPMKGIRVDPARRTARAEPGLTWGEFDRETQAFGLATTGGVVSTTGIAGLTLGGGIGWLMRTHGLACDNLLSVDVVTADGQLRTASAEENADLFWALRGGGGNFGVVTSFEYRLHPVGPTVLGGLLIWPRPLARDVLRALPRLHARRRPRTPAPTPRWGPSPDGVPIVVVIPFYHGPIEEGEALLRPLRDFGPPVADLVQPMPYTAFQQMLDALNPPGNRVYWKSAVLQRIDDDVLDTIIEHAAAAPSPLSAALIEFYGGAANRVGAQDDGLPAPRRRRTPSTPSRRGPTRPRTRPTSAGRAGCGRRCGPSRPAASTSTSSASATKARTASGRPTDRTTTRLARAQGHATTRPTSSASTRTSSRPGDRPAHGHCAPAGRS